MSFYAVYITSSDNQIIVSEVIRLDNSFPDQIITTGLLSALDNFTDSMKDGIIPIEYSIRVEQLCYFIKNFGDFTIVVVAEETHSLQPIAENIGWKFLRKYGNIDLLNWNITHSNHLFNQFKAEILEILTKFSIKFKETSPSKKLTTADIFNLPTKLQKTALAMLVMERASINDIANEIRCPDIVAEENLLNLHNRGFLGMSSLENTTFFYTS
ncbi:MAG: hypothetical protein OEY49_03100, partial [Candidatus Heimdallarchaeota archaeon]|nr:hypothetical protein [Candidatus Heimdallarchaeota archaeon]